MELGHKVAYTAMRAAALCAVAAVSSFGLKDLVPVTQLHQPNKFVGKPLKVHHNMLFALQQVEVMLANVKCVQEVEVAGARYLLSSNTSKTFQSSVKV